MGADFCSGAEPGFSCWAKAVPAPRSIRANSEIMAVCFIVASFTAFGLVGPGVERRASDF
jgi:hypothetical protein